MELLFSPSKIREYASEYDVDYDSDMEKLVPEIKKNKCITETQLIEISEWKLWSERNTHNIIKNSDGAIEEMTEFAFTAKSEIGRIGCLLCLSGVDIPIGSAILHWFHECDYPIWDWRALVSVQYDKTEYKNWFARWNAYVKFCRDTSKEYDVDMRTLDRALWIYPKSENR